MWACPANDWQAMGVAYEVSCGYGAYGIPAMERKPAPVERLSDEVGTRFDV